MAWSQWRGGRRGSRRLILGIVLALAGCAVPPEVRPPGPPVAPVPPRPPEVLPPSPMLRELPPVPTAPTPAAPPAPQVGRPRVAMAVRPIDLEMRCAAMDERRHTVQADVDIRAGVVRYLRARLTQPTGGVCEFALPDFRQSKTLPGIELRDPNSPCTLRLWEQGPQVVLAYSQCERHCAPNAAFAQLLPILFDRRVGHCD